MPPLAWRSSTPTRRAIEQLSPEAAEGRFLALVG